MHDTVYVMINGWPADEIGLAALQARLLDLLPGVIVTICDEPPHVGPPAFIASDYFRDFVATTLGLSKYRVTYNSRMIFAWLVNHLSSKLDARAAVVVQGDHYLKVDQPTPSPHRKKCT